MTPEPGLARPARRRRSQR